MDYQFPLNSHVGAVEQERQHACQNSAPTRRFETEIGEHTTPTNQPNQPDNPTKRHPYNLGDWALF